VMVIDLHEMMGRGDLEPKTSSYVRRSRTRTFFRPGAALGGRRHPRYE
jgi:hypothetical protein